MFSKTNQNRIIHCVLTLLLALMAFTAQGQRNTTVTGVVTDTQGPVPGVSIIVKGTLNGTTSDIDGKFSLNVKDKDILQVSCIGYLSQEINWNGQAEYLIKRGFKYYTGFSVFDEDQFQALIDKYSGGK